MDKLTQQEAEGIAQFWADLPVEIMDGDDQGYAQERWEIARDIFFTEMNEYLEENGYPDCYDLFNQMFNEGRAAPTR